MIKHHDNFEIKYKIINDPVLISIIVLYMN